jgi:predicted extracellular nuclease
VRRSPRRLIAALTSLTLAAVGAVVLAPPAAAASGDLLFSEYIEGSSNNKALEIYNPSTAPVDLAAAGYAVQLYFNGSTTAGSPIALTGTIAADDVFVLASSAAVTPAIVAAADQTTSASLYNGDDAVVLVKGGVIVDVIGQIGVDPGAEWGTGVTSTADNTIRRSADTCVGDTDGTNPFDPTVGWSGFATDTADGLGAHDADCALDPATDPDPDPDPAADCDTAAVAIGSVQGSGPATPVAGQTVEVEGTVTGDFQVGGFDGYYIQDGGDELAATSDGIFVSVAGGADVNPGDIVHVVGVVSESFGMTQIAATAVAVCDVGAPLPDPRELTLPAAAETYESLEGMRVTLPQTLSILEYFEFGRFGTIDVGLDRQMTPTAVFEPGSVDAADLAAANLAERITIDDGRSVQNPDPAIHPNGSVFTKENSFRGGDTVTNVTGVLDYRFSTWAVQPTQGADFAVVNPRPDVPDVGGDVTVASFNVLNYFTTIDPTPSNSNDDDYTRGADTAEELARQQAKIVAALATIDADVFGLIEIENSGVPGFPASTAAPNEAVATLTAALNGALGADVYDYIPTGVVGTDAITTALVYKTATVEPVGDFALLTESVDSRWLDDRNRPALAQTFADADGGTVTVVVNHLKSKGSSCDADGDPDAGDGQGNCAGVRTAAATALTEWLAGDPTGQGAGRELIIGDLNSYDKEDPIDALVDAGYTDLLAAEQGEYAYSYVFDGQLGYLDYALAGTDLVEDVESAAVWHINADEPSLFDYDMSFKRDAQDALFAPDPYRSSDHDPVLVGLDLTAPDTTPPTISVTADPSLLFPPNGKPRTVTITVDAADDSGDVSVEYVSAVAAGSKKAGVDKLTDTTFSVTAAAGAFYTFTYSATDAAGNTTIATTVVRVGR